MSFFFDLKGISPHWIWLGLTVLFAVIEAVTISLTTIWFALAGIILIFLSFLPIHFEFQVLIFLAVSAFLLIFTRPIAIKKFKAGKEKTNVDSIIGKKAIVIKQIGEFERGQIKFNDQVWSAKLEEGASSLGEGSRCKIIKIEGVQAIVRREE